MELNRRALKRARIVSWLLFAGFVPICLLFAVFSSAVLKNETLPFYLAGAWTLVWCVSVWRLVSLACPYCEVRNPYFWGIVGRCRGCRRPPPD